MKLHLPSRLRAALIACLAVVSPTICTTLSTAVLGGGLFVAAIAAQAEAEDYTVTVDEGEATLNTNVSGDTPEITGNLVSGDTLTKMGQGTLTIDNNTIVRNAAEIIVKEGELSVSYDGSASSSGFTANKVSVLAGATLTAAWQEVLGWSSTTNLIVLTGESEDNTANLQINWRQQMPVNLHLNGHTLVSNVTRKGYFYSNANNSRVEGVGENNVIAGNISLGKTKLTFHTETEADSITITGLIFQAKSNQEEGFIKTGAGTLTFDGVVDGAQVPDNANNYISGSENVLNSLTVNGGTVAVNRVMTVKTLTLGSGSVVVGQSGNLTISTELGFTGSASLQNNGDLTLGYANAVLNLAHISNSGRIYLGEDSLLRMDAGAVPAAGKYTVGALYCGEDTLSGDISGFVYGLVDGRQTATYVADAGGDVSKNYIEVTLTSYSFVWDGSTDATWSQDADTMAWSGTWNGTGTAQGLDNATFDSTASAKTITLSGDLVANNVTVSDAYTFSVADASSASLTVAGKLDMTGGSLTKAGAGDLTLNMSENTEFGALTISGGSLVISTAEGTESTVASLSGGTGTGFTKTGSGKLTVTDLSGYSSGVTVSGGALTVGSDATLGSIALADGGTFAVAAGKHVTASSPNGTTFSSGTFTISLGEGATLTDSAAAWQLRGSAVLNIEGSGTNSASNGVYQVERLCMTVGGGGGTANIQAGVTLYVNGTTQSVSSDTAAFLLSNNGGTGTINIYGKLISNAGMANRDGDGVINIHNGGELELLKGLGIRRNNDGWGSVNVNVFDGATLRVAENTTGYGFGGYTHVNLSNGSTVAASGTTDVEIGTNTPLTFISTEGGDKPIVKFSAVNGQTFTISCGVAEAGGVSAIGGGTIVLADANSFAGSVAVAANTALTLGGTPGTLSSIQVGDAGSLTVGTSLDLSGIIGSASTYSNEGTLVLSGEATLKLQEGSTWNVGDSFLIGAVASSDGTTETALTAGTIGGVIDGFDERAVVTYENGLLTITSLNAPLYWNDEESTWSADTLWAKEDGGTASLTFRAGDNANFVGAAAETVAIDGPVSASTLTVKDGSYTFTVADGTEDSLTVTGSLTVENGIMDAASSGLGVDLSTAAVTLAAGSGTTPTALKLGSSTTIKSLDSAGTLAVDGDLTLTTATAAGGMVEAANVTLAGADNSFTKLTATGNVTNGTGTLSLGDGSDIDGKLSGGNLSVTGGTVAIGSLDGVGSITNNGTLQLAGDLTLTAVTTAGGTVQAKNASLTGMGNSFTFLTLDGDLTLNALARGETAAVTLGGLSATNDTLNIVLDAAMLDGLNMELNETLTLATLSSGLTGLTVQLNGSATLPIQSEMYSYSLVTNENSIELQASYLGNEWNGTWPVISGAVNFLGQAEGEVDISTHTSGEVEGIVVDTTNPLAADETANYTFTNGTLTVAGDVHLINGSVAIAEGATITASGTTSTSDGTTLTVDGTLGTAEMHLLAGSTFTNDGATSVSGTLESASGITNSTGATLTAGTMKLTSGASLTNGGSVTVGTLDAAPATITNNSGATLTVQGNSSLGGLTGAGTLKIENGATLTMQADTSLSAIDSASRGTLASTQGLTLTSVITATGLSVQADTLTLVGSGHSLAGATFDTLVLDDTLLSDTSAYLTLNNGALGGTALSFAFTSDIDTLASTLTQGGKVLEDSWNLISGIGSTTAADFALDPALTAAVHEYGVELSVTYDAASGQLMLTTKKIPEHTWESDTPLIDVDGNIVPVDPTTGNYGGTNIYASLDYVGTVDVSSNVGFDLTTASPDDSLGLVVSNPKGDAGKELSFVGDLKADGSLDDIVTLKVAPGTAITAAEGAETVNVQTVLLQVGAPDAALPGTKGQLHVASVNLSEGAVMNVNDAGIDFSVGQLYGTDGTGNVQGSFTVTDDGGSYNGSYGTPDATATLSFETGANQTLYAGEGLVVAGTGGHVTLKHATPNTKMKALVVPGGAVHQIATNGTNITIDSIAGGSMRTLVLNADSYMNGGALNVIVQAGEIHSGTAAAITSGKNFKLNGTTLTITQDADYTTPVTFDLSEGTKGLTVITLADSSTGSGDVEVLLSGNYLQRYFENAHLQQDGTVTADLVTDYYTRRLARTPNGRVGMQMLDTALLEVNPTANAAQYADLAGVLDSLETYRTTNNADAADKLAAAVAGAGVAAVGSAAMGDVDRQLKAIRNRMTSMGVDQCVVNEDMPYFNAWINAEGDHREMSADGTLAGYTLSSWGGTVGMDIDVIPELTFGLAATAMYGDYTGDSADQVEGDMDSYYLSLFARVTHRSWVHSFVATAGRQDISLERTVNYGMGNYRTEGDTTGTSFGFMYEVGKTIALNEDASTCWQPVFNVAYRHVGIDGYSESGSDAALTFGDQELNMVTFGLGARLQTAFGENVYNRTSLFEMRALAKFDAGDRASESEVGFAMGGHTAKVEGAEMGAFGVELGAGLTVPIGQDGGSLFFDASLELRSDYTNGNGTVGYRINF